MADATDGRTTGDPGTGDETEASTMGRRDPDSQGGDGGVPGDPAHGIDPMPSPEGVDGATDFSVIDE